MSDEIDAGCQREQEDTAKAVAAAREAASRIEIGFAGNLPRVRAKSTPYSQGTLWQMP